MFWCTEEYPGLDEQLMAEKHGVAVYRNLHLGGHRVVDYLQEHGHVGIAVRAMIAPFAGAKQHKRRPATKPLLPPCSPAAKPRIYPSTLRCSMVDALAMKLNIRSS